MKVTQDLYFRFREFEESSGVFDIRVGGVYFWERLRTRIYFQLYFRALGSKKKLMPSFDILLRLKFYLMAFLNLFRNPFFTGRKDVLIIGHPRRLRGRNKRWWDIYVDTWIEDLRLSHIAMEENYGLVHRKPARTKSLHYLDFLDMMGRLRTALGLSKISLKTEEVEKLEHLQQLITDRFGISLNIERFVRTMLRERQARLPLYLRLLAIIKPRCVVIVNSLGKENLVEACKRLSIPVAELQHGVVNRYHPTYSYEGNKNRLAFPDYMLVWGDYWKQSASYPIRDSHVVSVGFPFIERELRECRGLSKKPQILFISQGYTADEISRLALEVSEKAEGKYKVVYKLHPAECDVWKQFYPWLVNSRVVVIDRKESNIHRLFAESTAQVGVASTAIYEGLAHGLDTYVLDTSGAEYFDDLASRGVVKMISSADELLDAIACRSEKQPIDMEYFFKQKSSRNIVRFIHSLASTD